MGLFKSEHEDQMPRVYSALNELKTEIDNTRDNMKAMDSVIINSQVQNEEVVHDGIPFKTRVDDLEKGLDKITALIKELKLHTKLIK